MRPWLYVISRMKDITFGWLVRSWYIPPSVVARENSNDILYYESVQLVCSGYWSFSFVSVIGFNLGGELCVCMYTYVHACICGYHTHLVTGNLAIKTIVARQWLTNSNMRLDLFLISMCILHCNAVIWMYTHVLTCMYIILCVYGSTGFPNSVTVIYCT